MNTFQKYYNSIFKKEVPIKSLYDERIDCFNKMISLQEYMKKTDEEYIRVTLIEGKEHTNAYHRLKLYRLEYEDLYDKCKSII